MPKKFYISDWHYGHANVIGFDARPFLDVEEMNRELIRRWNSVVSPGDLVYILGDMFWCKSSEAIPILKRLNGQKILIKGNHDRCNDTEFKKQFVKITEYLEVEDEGSRIVLCHYPIPCFKNHFYGWYHFYGHVHTSFEYNIILDVRRKMEQLHEKQCRMLNVGAMMPYMNFTPRTFTELKPFADEFFGVFEN